MTFHRLLSLLLAFAMLTLCGADWRHFRGTDTTSNQQDGANPPVAWKTAKGDEQAANVAWMHSLPGRGVSGPIVVGDRVFVTSSSGFKQDRLHVVAMDAKSGKQLWERQFWATGRTVCHPTSAVAASTPTSDGEHVVALFSSNDLVCLDLDGNLKWIRGLTLENPTASNDVGMASSPLIVGDTVVVQVESMGRSFATGIDIADGTTRWQLDRKLDSNWASPTLLPGATPADDLVLLQSTDRLTAHRPQTGEQVWSFEAGCSSISSTAAEGATLFVPAKGLTALRYVPGASAVETLWESGSLSPSSVCPVVHDGKVYTINSAGVLLCGDATTGEVVWKLRLKGNFWATPVISGNTMYVVNQDGLAQVISLAGKGEIVATNDFAEEILGSPAVADGAIYFRSGSHLWKIAG